MRPIVLGLIAAAMAAILPAAAVAATPTSPAPKPPEITKDARDQGMKAAPKLLAALNLPCQVSDARLIGQDPKTKQTYYEVACKAAMGYILVDRGAGKAPIWQDCVDQEKVDAQGKVNGAACYLPGNSADPKTQLAPFVAATKVACDVTQARGIGHSDEADYFEVGCQNGRDYVLKTSAPASLDKPAQLITCLAYANTPISCKFSTSDAQLAVADQLAAQSGKGCQVTNRRYMLTAQDFSNYWEVACQNGKGYVLREDASGKLGDTIDCAVADQIAGGCTLTNARQSQTEEASLYSNLAKKAGFACDVSKYGPINANLPGREVVELACSNRPDGAIAIFPANPAEVGQVFDCAHSELAGYRCSFTEASAAYPKLTSDLTKLGKTSCAVSGERTVGVSDADHLGYLEVACADGNPGYVVSYNLPAMTPKEAIACGFARDINGGCQLPTNKPKGS
jgi:hypothetical protein